MVFFLKNFFIFELYIQKNLYTKIVYDIIIDYKETTAGKERIYPTVIL